MIWSVTTPLFFIRTGHFQVFNYAIIQILFHPGSIVVADDF
jgi:hypothetical protein